MVWASASTWSTPGITGRPGKCPAKYHSDEVMPLIPTIRLASGSYSTMRSTSRNGWRCGISSWIWAVVRMVSVTGDSGGFDPSSLAAGGACQRDGVCRSASTEPRWSGAGGRRKERGAAHPIEQVRGHPALEEGLGGEQRLVDVDVRREAVDHQLLEGDPTAGDGRRPVRTPD